MNYIDNVIRDVLLNGLVDIDIRREILGMKDIFIKSINDIIVFIEGKEMVRNVLSFFILFVVSIF